MKNKGKLIVIGTGIMSPAQVTIESLRYLEYADFVFYLVADVVAEEWILSKNSGAKSLHPHYSEGKNRRESYEGMKEEILSKVREGLNVCAVFYGHPGVFVYPSHRAIKQALSEGYEARMLPGVSAEDCIFSDIGIDPGYGCQTFEATDLLVHDRVFDPHCLLILWQVGVIGCVTYNPGYDPKTGLASLLKRLQRSYPDDHELIMYEASQFAVSTPRVERFQLKDMLDIKANPISTLVIEPLETESVNMEMLDTLKMKPNNRLQRTR